jgi:catechol 2,3-dioxygenase-like lactoylglutathione lyase family enzyme
MSRPAITFEGFSLPVASLERSVPFYEALGFTTEIRTDQFALMRLGSGTLGLLQVGGAARETLEPTSGLRTLIQAELSTDALDELYAYFLQQKIAVRVPPRDRGFERSMQLLDPDGFTVEFAEGRRGRNATR